MALILPAIKPLAAPPYVTDTDISELFVFLKAKYFPAFDAAAIVFAKLIV